MAISRTAWGYLLLVVTALGWSGAWVTARLAAHDAPPMTVTVGRFAIAAVALLPAWLAFDRSKRIGLSRRDWQLVLGMSLTGITTYTVLFLIGVSLAPATDGSIITPGFVGLFAIGIAWTFTGDRPGRTSLIGAVLALIGSLIVGWGALRSGGLGSDRLLGALVFVASAAAYGAYTVLGRRLSDTVPAVTGVLLASALGAVLLAPVALWVEGVPDLAGWSWRAWLNVVYLGLVATAVSFVTYYLGVQYVGVGRTAPALGLVPLFSVIGAAALLGDQVTWSHGLGGVLVIAGIMLPAVRQRPGPAADGSGAGNQTSAEVDPEP